MLKGRVRWFDKNKCIGFIEKENGEEIFFHCAGIEDVGIKSIAKGDTVTFDVARGPKGMQATKVKKSRPA